MAWRGSVMALELDLLVRGACPFAPALLFGAIAQAVRVEAERLAAR